MKQAIDQLINQYKEKHGPNADVFYTDFSEPGDDIIGAVEDQFKAVSFFDNKKILILKQAFGGGNGENVAELIKKRNLAEDKNTILIIAENGDAKELAKKSKKLWDLLSSKNIQTKEIEPLSGKKLESWLIKEAENLGLMLGPALAQELIAFAGEDAWRLSREVAKLAAYSRNKTLKSDDIKLLVRPKEDLNIFEFLDVLSSKNKAKALALLEERLASGDDPHYLISMIAYQLRNLVAVKDLADKAVPFSRMANLAGIHPFAAKKAFDCSRKFELQELKMLFSRLARLDRDIKNGDIKDEDGLYKFILEW